MPPLQARAAELVHVGLYVFLLLQAVSGYVRVTTGGFPIEALRGGRHPAAAAEGGGGDARSPRRCTRSRRSVLIVLIAMHVAAAAYHGIVRRDGVFSLMWPPIAPKRPRG